MLDHPLQPLVHKLNNHVVLDQSDIDGLLELPHVVREYPAAAYLVRQGEKPGICPVLLDGFAIRSKMAVNGARQIVAIQLPGDALDLQHLYLDRADHNVQALTAVAVAQLVRSDLQALASKRLHILQAITVNNLVEASISREWLLNVGRRSAIQRVAHLFCEVAVRLQHQGLGEPRSLVLPMTQEQIGDATALTGVHVNRTIKALYERKVIARSGKAITLTDWDLLKAIAEFNPEYLHQHQQSIRSG